MQISLEPSKKDEFVGLYGLPLLTLAFKIFPQAIAETAIRIGYQNPLIGMSNIGLLNQKDYAMGDKLPYYAWYTGAIKYKPYIQLAATTFMGEITFSVAVRCNEEDCKIIDGFYNILFGLLGQLDY